MPRILTRISMATLATLGAGVASAAVSVLHSFDGAGGGANPTSALALSGGTLFGSTLGGGASGTGALFRIETDGSAFQKLHDFDAFADPLGEGSFPSGPLTPSGGVLFGTAEFGGSAFDGVVFSINQDGTGYTPLHELDDTTAAAASPSGGVLVDGGTLHGVTLFGSATTEGSIYSVASNGAGFNVLHAFAGDGSEGEETTAPLTLVGQTLWGVAGFGGASDAGTLFRYDLSGSGFSVAHAFGAGSDGATPIGRLLPVGGWLYGLTQDGGDSGDGTLYRVLTDGTGYETIHSFQGGPDEGAAPVGGLTEVNGRLFGATSRGGPSDIGTLFSIETDGTDLRLHHAFSGSDGASPTTGLVAGGTTLYGVASEGGSNDAGTVFSIDANALAGDYNADGVVDAADYTVWRDSLGSTTSLAADGDFSGVVDAADYAIWVTEFGSSPEATASAVPEPTTAILLVAGWLTRSGRQRCR